MSSSIKGQLRIDKTSLAVGRVRMCLELLDAFRVRGNDQAYKDMWKIYVSEMNAAIKRIKFLAKITNKKHEHYGKVFPVTGLNEKCINYEFHEESHTVNWKDSTVFIDIDGTNTLRNKGVYKMLNSHMK